MNKSEEKYTKLFEELCKLVGWSCTRSADYDNMHNHFDCVIMAPENGTDGEVQTLKIELKGNKYTKRSNQGDPKCLCQYIEYMNVKGEIGWLFGKADYIAMLNENADGFYFVTRSSLMAHSEKLFGVLMKGRKWIEIIPDLQAKKEHWVKDAPQIHKLYKRYNRNDMVTQITMEEVKDLAIFELRYMKKDK